MFWANKSGQCETNSIERRHALSQDGAYPMLQLASLFKLARANLQQGSTFNVSCYKPHEVRAFVAVSPLYCSGIMRNIECNITLSLQRACWAINSAQLSLSPALSHSFTLPSLSLSLLVSVCVAFWLTRARQRITFAGLVILNKVCKVCELAKYFCPCVN